MQVLNFNDCTKQGLGQLFGIQRVMESGILKDWLDAGNQPINEVEQIVLEEVRQKAMYAVDDWNEFELFGNLIAFVINIAKLDTPTFRFFGQRDLSAQINDIELKGKVDGMLATGFQFPKEPYFCLNEYKKSMEYAGDPAGQCLAAMLVAQAINNNNTPVYGIYVIGRSWYFLVLDGKNYCVSREFDATESDIFEIVKILKKLKCIVISLLSNEKK